MRLSDVQPRLLAPFPASVIAWKPGMVSKDRKRAMMLAHVDARAVQDRLDAICCADWHFTVDVVPGARQPTVKGSLTVLGVTRQDIGEAPEGDLGTLKAASSDALKRCAVHFGIGRYLYDLPRFWVDWDDAKRQPVTTPTLPEWAMPEHERQPGARHIVQALDYLRRDLPEDLDLQRDVYKHLKAALSSLHPDRPAAQKAAEEPAEALAAPTATADAAAPSDGQPAPAAATLDDSGASTKQQRSELAQHAARGGASTPQQRSFMWGAALKLAEPVPTTRLTYGQAAELLKKCAKASDAHMTELLHDGVKLFEDLPF